MYENIYSHNEEVFGKHVWMIFEPNFREAVTLFDEEYKILSDAEIRKEEDLDIDGTQNRFPYVYPSENAQWLLEDQGFALILYVTESTYNIKTPLGEEWNMQFNQMLKKCKREYYKKKKKEVRLYFFDACRNRLQLCYKDTTCKDIFEYSLNRAVVSYSAIDKRFKKPDKDCFILGKVRKTIGVNNSKLLDFIEPVKRVDLNFEKDWWDCGEYDEKKQQVESVLFKLLSFCVTKKQKHSRVEIMRIRAYFSDYKSKDSEIISKFKGIIKKAFESGKSEDLSNLADVLNNRQDCTDVKFELRLEEEVECLPTKTFFIYFENGEKDIRDAIWIYKNIHNCTDSKGVYLGEMRDRYNFF